MKIRELKEYLEGYPDDGEVWMETGAGLSSPVERIELLNFRGPKEHDLLIGPREGHGWANGVAREAGAGRAIPRCSECGNEIDPETCWCGDDVAAHHMESGHSPVPMGCTCGFRTLRSPA